MCVRFSCVYLLVCFEYLLISPVFLFRMFIFGLFLVACFLFFLFVCFMRVCLFGCIFCVGLFAFCLSRLIVCSVCTCVRVSVSAIFHRRFSRSRLRLTRPRPRGTLTPTPLFTRLLTASRCPGVEAPRGESLRKQDSP